MVLDAFSRRVVGWSMAHHLRSELVLGALNMALAQRRPDGVVHHSDKGSQYTSLAFGKRCREMGVLPSTSSAGDCFDNAMAERFFATPECELINRFSPARGVRVFPSAVKSPYPVDIVGKQLLFPFPVGIRFL